VTFDLSLAVLAAVGLVLVSAWYNLLLLGRERQRHMTLRHIWQVIEDPGIDATACAQQLCQRVRVALESSYCSLWILGPSSGIFRPVAHDGAPEADGASHPRISSLDRRDSGSAARATIPGEVPSEIVSRAWSTGAYQEWSSGGQRWVVQPVSPHQDGGGALVVRLGRVRPAEREMLQLAAVPAATLALRLGHDRELYRTRRELDDMRADLLEESKLAAVGRLAAGVAHELNTPLGAVLTMVGSMSRIVKDDDVSRRLAIVREGVEKCKSIIEKLLVFSRGPLDGADGLTFSRFVRTPTEVNRIVRESLELLSEPLAEAGIRVVQDLGALPPIRANATQWGQVITNLIANARDAFRDHAVADPTITVRTSADDRTITLEVSDNGPGIPANVVGRIFDPFFTTKDIGKGTGLGLAIVREIVKKHDGTIEVSSRDGQGATFTIRVPAGAAARVPSGA